MGVLELHRLRMGAWLTPRNTIPHMCYHAKFGHSDPNSTCMHVEVLWKICIHHTPPPFSVTEGHQN